MPNLEKKSQPSESEIREFWEWCGIEIESITDGIPLERIGEGRLMAHPIDLNNLFKDAVPKAIDKIKARDGGTEYGAYEILFSDWLLEGYDADALYLAIWGIIDKGGS